MVPNRPHHEKLLAGVCASLARSLVLDVTLVRLAFMVLALAWGLGVVLYGALWLLLPNEGQLTTGLKMRGRMRRNVQGMRGEVRRSARVFSEGWNRLDRQPWPRPINRQWLALTMMAAGLLIFLGSLGAFAWLTLTRAVGLVAMCGGAAVLISLRQRDSE